jgi:hypothetical protein
MMKFYLAIRKNETMWFEGKWKQSKDIMLSEDGRLRKTKAACFLSYAEIDTA